MLLALNGACSSTVAITSNPSDAEIIAKPVGAGAEIKLGKTPTVLDDDALEQVPGGSGPVRLQLRKPGYRPVDILVTEISASNLTIHTELEASSGFEDAFTLNQNLDKIFAAQQLIRQRQFQQAQTLLLDTQKTFPQLAVTYELLGGTYYFLGDKGKASEAFQRAVILNPNSVDALAGLSRSTASTAPATPSGGNGGPDATAATTAETNTSATDAPATPAAGEQTTTPPTTEGGTQ
jgi:hypothetical protein